MTRSKRATCSRRALTTQGLVTAITIEAASGALLMLAHMNAEALSLTLETGEVHYFSRSRGKLWKKGETSGEVQKLVEIRTDCDQDALMVLVEQTGRGAACHTGRKTCFYRRVAVSNGEATLVPHWREAAVRPWARLQPLKVTTRGRLAVAPECSKNGTSSRPVKKPPRCACQAIPTRWPITSGASGTRQLSTIQIREKFRRRRRAQELGKGRHLAAKCHRLAGLADRGRRSPAGK